MISTAHAKVPRPIHPWPTEPTRVRKKTSYPDRDIGNPVKPLQMFPAPKCAAFA